MRDGRDALVSWARQAAEDDGSRFEPELRKMILRTDQVGTGSWGRNVLSWLLPTAPHRMVLRYEDLARDPHTAVEHILAALWPDLKPLNDASIPSFADLQLADGRFFRRGHTATHRDELPDELHELFWAQPATVTAMELLGYGIPVEEPHQTPTRTSTRTSTTP